MTRGQKWILLGFLMLGLCLGPVIAQLQQSGGPGSTVTIGTALPAGSNVIGHVIADSGSTTVVTGNVTAVQGTGSNLHTVVDSGTVVNGAGTANMGMVRILPSSCTQSTPFANTTVGVAISTGTSITSTATCVTFAFANNITNSPVTLRIQDKSGTPIIWLGGGTDFIIPGNSNIRIPLEGVTFVGGITAIAGTGSAINLQINGVQ